MNHTVRPEEKYGSDVTDVNKASELSRAMSRQTDPSLPIGSELSIASQPLNLTRRLPEIVGPHSGGMNLRRPYGLGAVFERLETASDPLTFLEDAVKRRAQNLDEFAYPNIGIPVPDLSAGHEAIELYHRTMIRILESRSKSGDVMSRDVTKKEAKGIYGRRYIKYIINKGYEHIPELLRPFYLVQDGYHDGSDALNDLTPRQREILKSEGRAQKIREAQDFNHYYAVRYEPKRLDYKKFEAAKITTVKQARAFYEELEGRLLFPTDENGTELTGDALIAEANESSINLFITGSFAAFVNGVSKQTPRATGTGEDGTPNIFQIFTAGEKEAATQLFKRELRKLSEFKNMSDQEFETRFIGYETPGFGLSIAYQDGEPILHITISWAPFGGSAEYIYVFPYNPSTEQLMPSLGIQEILLKPYGHRYNDGLRVYHKNPYRAFKD